MFQANPHVQKNNDICTLHNPLLH